MRMLSLFSGIGGIDLAAQWAGIETVAFCEIDPYCQKVLKKHWPDVPIYSDIKELRGEDIGTVDIVAGGFPCQPFSVAGKQRSKEDDRYLWPEMFRIIQETKPTWVVGENVPGIINLALDQVLSELESTGYETITFNIPACGVNAPHRRARIFIVGYSEHNGQSAIKKLRSNEATSNKWGQEEQKKTRELARANRPTNVPSLRRSKEGSQQDVANTRCKLWKSRNATEMGTDKRKWTHSNIHNKSSSKGYRTGQWKSEPNVGRVANGISRRVDKLRGLGNAVVPQQIYPIFKAIAKIEGGNA